MGQPRGGPGSSAPLIITPRQRRDLEARFKKDMRALHERLAQGPHPRDTKQQLIRPAAETMVVGGSNLLEDL